MWIKQSINLRNSNLYKQKNEFQKNISKTVLKLKVRKQI